MVIGYSDDNDLCFAIKIPYNNARDRVTEAIKVGVSAWYEAAHDDIEPNEYFTTEDIEGFYEIGYAEPTIELLDRWNIEYEFISLDDDEGVHVDIWV